MKNSFTYLIITAFLLSGYSGNAQDLRYCGTDEMVSRSLGEHPEFWQQQQELQEHALNFREDLSNHSMPPVYTVPVVFHIIHEYGTENISDAQINDAMAILNIDYRKLNADTANIVPGFQSIAKDAEIQFKLARKDPAGNCTTGIDRIVSPETFIGDDGSKLNYWDRTKYLNIWVVKNISSGAAGYAYLPGTAPSASVDGILVLSTYVGSIGTGSTTTSRTLTHEVGHFLNLQHVWGFTNQPGVQCGDDFVGDTPWTKGWTTCNLSNNDICNVGIDENVQNYMEYSYCTNMFTVIQCSRMRSCLTTSVAGRNNLPTAANLLATGVNLTTVCAPISDFFANNINICAGSSVNFSWSTNGGHPTTWSWNFPGGNPVTSPDSFPVVQYNTPGVYNVSLTVTNASGSNTLTKTAYIYVSPTTATYASWQYFEGFENISSLPSTDWQVINSGGNTWSSITGPNQAGTRSVRVMNSVSESGLTDDLIGPGINLSLIPSPVMTFWVAFAQRTSSDNDRLNVYISTNCGQTWNVRYTKTGSNLKTVPPTTISFVPSNAITEWRMETVNISSYSSATNAKFKFSFLSDGGNNIYIDNINISGANGVNELENNFLLSVFPNPFSDQTSVAFVLQGHSNVNLSVTDVLGKEIKILHSGDLDPGTHQFGFSRNDLSPGLYFVRLNVNGNSFTQKIVITE